MDAREVSRRLLLKINQLRLSSELCDVTLMVGDVLLPAHRVVLASSSQFFASMLTKDEPAATFQIKGIAASEVLRVLDFMYTGQIPLNKSNISATRTIANHLQVDLLLETCDKFENKSAPVQTSDVSGGAKNRPCKRRKTAKKQTVQALSTREKSNQLQASCPAPSRIPGNGNMPSSRSYEIVTCLPNITHTESVDSRQVVTRSHVASSTPTTLPQTEGIHVIIEQAAETSTGEELACVVVDDRQNTELLPIIGYEAVMECEPSLDPTTAQSSGEDQPASANFQGQAPELTVPMQTPESGRTEALSAPDKHKPRTRVKGSCQRTHPCLSLIQKEKSKNIGPTAVVLAETELSTDQLICVGGPDSPGLVNSECYFQEQLEVANTGEASLVTPGHPAGGKEGFQKDNMTHTIISAAGNGDKTLVLETLVPLVDSFETLTGQCAIEPTNFHDYCSVETPIDILKSEVNVINTESVDGLTSSNLTVRSDERLLCDDEDDEGDVNCDNEESSTPDEHKCEWCSYTYSDPENYRSHVKRKHKDRMYNCKHCSRKFISWKKCDIHTDICQIPNVNGRFLCTQCDYTAAKLNSVVEHFRIKHKTSSLIQCKQCDRTFVNSVKYYEHAFQVHGLDVSQLPSKVRIHQCHICEYQTTRLSAFRFHQQKHTSIQCKICQKPLSSGSSLQRHMTQLHGQGTSYKCDMCDHSTIYKSTHEAHLYRMHRIITAKKDVVHQCPHCDFTHVKMPMLRKHVQQRHSDVRPFLCSFCPQSFKNKILLTTHEHRHQGYRPYKCVQCSYAGLSRAGLLQHLKMAHSSEKPFCCELCGHATKTLGNLNKHKKACSAKYEGKQPESDKTEVDFFQIDNLL